jgi:hypothetical protein
MQDSPEAIPLENSELMPALQIDDRRPRMPEPLPVRLLTVDDARLIAGAGLEEELDDFYIKMLGFERGDAGGHLAYRAENFSVVFDVVEPPVRRGDMRILGVELSSLTDAEAKLIAAEIEYTRQKGLNPGQENLLLRDPAGNWIALSGASLIR